MKLEFPILSLRQIPTFDAPGHGCPQVGTARADRIIGKCRPGRPRLENTAQPVAESLQAPALRPEIAFGAAQDHPSVSDAHRPRELRAGKGQ
jgi:hypothetical protein